MPVPPLALRVPVSAPKKILAFPHLNLPTREQGLLVNLTLFVGVDVGDEISRDDVINTGSVAGIRVGAASGEWTRKQNVERRSAHITATATGFIVAARTMFCSLLFLRIAGILNPS